MSVTTPLGGLPRPPLEGPGGLFTTAWAAWLNVVQNVVRATSSSGPTTSRPTTNLYVGQFFFDTTLGIPVWVKTPGSSPVWVNATGNPV